MARYRHCRSIPADNQRALEQLAREEAAFDFCRRALSRARYTSPQKPGSRVPPP